MQRVFLLIFPLMFTLVGCKESADTASENKVISECAGFITVNVNFANLLPPKISIVWMGQVTIDECVDSTALSHCSYGVCVTKDPNKVTIDSGGFGATIPTSIGLIVKDCSTGNELFSVSDYQVSEPAPKFCESRQLDFNQ